MRFSSGNQEYLLFILLIRNLERIKGKLFNLLSNVDLKIMRRLYKLFLMNCVSVFSGQEERTEFMYRFYVLFILVAMRNLKPK